MCKNMYMNVCKNMWVFVHLCVHVCLCTCGVCSGHRFYVWHFAMSLFSSPTSVLKSMCSKQSTLTRVNTYQVGGEKRSTVPVLPHKLGDRRHYEKKKRGDENN